MRILMGMPKPGLVGGPQGHLPFLVAGLKASKVEVVELTYGSLDGNPSLLGRISQVLKTARAMRRATRASAFDVVQLNTAFDVKALLRDVVTVALIRRRRRHKILLKFHGSDAGLLATSNPVLRMLGQALMAMADGMGTLSCEERDNFLRAGADAGKLHIVKNILDPSLYHHDAGFRERLGVNRETILLLFAGRMIPEKGLIDLVRACGILHSAEIDFHLVCLGDGPGRRPAEEEAARLNIGDRATFLGQIPESDTRPFYANCSMLVFPTYHQEGFPMTVFQAVAAGLPVITTKIRAAADYLKEPDNCLWVEPKEPGIIADKIRSLMDDSVMRQHMAANNRALGAQFTRSIISAEFLGIYKVVVNRGEARLHCHAHILP